MVIQYVARLSLSRYRLWTGYEKSGFPMPFSSNSRKPLTKSRTSTASDSGSKYLCSNRCRCILSFPTNSPSNVLIRSELVRFYLEITAGLEELEHGKALADCKL